MLQVNKFAEKNKMTTSVYFVLLIPITIDKNLVHVCLYYWYSGITILLFGPRKQITESNYHYTRIILFKTASGSLPKKLT